METLLETILLDADYGVTLIETDILIDLPWLVVAQVRYTNGSRFDITWSEHAEPEDFNLFINHILPAGALWLTASRSRSLPEAEHEWTCSYWAMP